jgi:hypothetical protein
MSRAWLEAAISVPAGIAVRQPTMVPARRVREELAPGGRVALSGDGAPPAYTEAEILQALRRSDSALGRCWLRSGGGDGGAARKVRLHLEVSASGAVRRARAEPEDGALLASELPACITEIGRRLPLPARGRPAELSLLLLF